MNFETVTASEAIAKLIDEEGLFVSLFLPYGVSGQNERKLGIERKKALSALYSKIAPQDIFWRQGFEQIRQENQQAKIDQPPCTRAYFFNHNFSLRVDIPDELRAHFSLATYAELEPLIYLNWAYEPFMLCHIEQEEMKLYRAYGAKFEKLSIEIPDHLKQSIGPSIKDFSFKNVVDVADLNSNPGTDLDSGGQAGLHGLSSRQQSHADKKRGYWLRLLGDIFAANVTESPQQVYIYGSAEITRGFQEVLSKYRIPTENFISERFKSKSELIHHIMKQIIHRKLARANQRFDDEALKSNIYDILDLIKTGQTKELFIEQLDWFKSQNRQGNSYEFHNPRSAIISRAMQYHTKINYTNKPINNRHHLCALAY